jgi:DNA-binding transcriptional LysR family regulator
MAQDVLTGMRVFTTVVDLGSFSKAAEHLDLSRGMTSRYVAAVETRLGVRLLNRTTRHISLTEAGNEYHQHALEILSLVERAESAAGQSVAKPRGTLRISAPMSFGKRSLGPVIEAYLREYPEVKLDLNLSDRTVDLVEEGVDLAIRITRRPDAQLVARPLSKAGVILCASPAYLRNHGMPKSPGDLTRHNCLTYAYWGDNTTWRFTRNGKETAVRVSGNCRCNNGELLASAAAAGLGLVCEPSFIVDEALRARKLIRVLPGWDAEPLTVYAVYANRSFLPPKVRSLIDFLAAWFQKTPDWQSVGHP